MSNETNRGQKIIMTYELYLAMEVVLILENGVVVSVHANSIGEHLLLVVKKGVGAEVVGEVDAFVHRHAAVSAIAGAALVSNDSVCVAPHVVMQVS